MAVDETVEIGCCRRLTRSSRLTTSVQSSSLADFRKSPLKDKSISGPARQSLDRDAVDERIDGHSDRSSTRGQQLHHSWKRLPLQMGRERHRSRRLMPDFFRLGTS